MPSWIFPSLFMAALLHVIEEHYIPGGFLKFARRLGGRIARQLTPRVAAIVNGLFLLLALVAALFWRTYPVLSLSAASLMAVNALLHTGGSIRARRYTPGLFTAVLLYVPLSLAAFITAVEVEFASPPELVLAALLGIVYHLLLFGTLWLLTVRSNGAAA